MRNIERKDLVKAILDSRDELDPELETEFLEAILDAERSSASDRNAAMCAIDVALTAAIGRGVGYRQSPDPMKVTTDNTESTSEGREGGT